MKLIFLGICLLTSTFNAAATNQCNRVIIEDSDLGTGKITSQGLSKYPLEFYENGNIMMISMHGIDFEFQTNPIRNDKWKEGDRMQMRTGKIQTSESSSQLIYIKDGGNFSGVQVVIKSNGMQRSLMGVDCIADTD